MSTENDFLPFATGSGANVLSQSSYAALQSVPTGFVSGVADSAAVNKVLRQASTMAAVLAQFVADNSGQPVIDNGNITTLENNLLAAVQAIIQAYGYAPLASPALSGSPTAPTAATSDASTKLANTQFVHNALVPYAPLNSPTFGGTPSASTPGPGDNTAKLATTGFVAQALNGGGANYYSPVFATIGANALDTGGFQLRLMTGSYGAGWRNDGTNFWLLATPAGQPGGSYNGLRPFVVNLATGNITLGAAGETTAFGGPVILSDGGSLSGTFGGNPVFSGIVRLAGGGELDGNIAGNPNFTGAPGTTTPAVADNSGRVPNTAWVRQQNFQPSLGFTPVQQGGGVGQGTNKLFLGWSGSDIKATVDATDMGAFAMMNGFGVRNDGNWFVVRIANHMEVAFGSGTVNNGSQIPLPSGGFAYANMKAIASPNNIASNSTSGSSELQLLTCSIDGNGYASLYAQGVDGQRWPHNGSYTSEVLNWSGSVYRTF